MMRSDSENPCLLGTWSFALPALEAAWPHLDGDAEDGVLEAVEAACVHADLDSSVDSVGWGGLPDASGEMSLDGAIMVSPERAGGVCGLRHHLHPVSVSRRVMDCTEHTLLCGTDADRFADRHGIRRRETLSPEARDIWEGWIDGRRRGDRGNPDLRPIDSGDATDGRLFRSPARKGAAPAGHDTIGVLARDGGGRMAAACSTSGLPFKVPGRVGDSPIVGHGLYVVPGVGQATATGTGEMISGVCASFLATEILRRGGSPQDAAVETIRRIDDSYRLEPHHQVAVVVMDSKGAASAAALRPGFRLAIVEEDRRQIVDPDLVIHPQDGALPESAFDGLTKPPPTPRTEAP